MSTINVTNIKGKGGASPNLPDGANVTGVVTATGFVGSGANLTGLANTDFINSEQITVVGVVTAGTGNIGNLNITKSAAGAGATVGSFTGVTTYYGDGSSLTGVGETIAPWNYNPDINDILAPLDTGIGVTFNKKISAGSGTATLKIVNAGTAGTTIQSWGVSSCTFGVTNLTFGALVSNLEVNQTYQVDIPSGFIVDSNETSYAGTAYTFASADKDGLLFTWGFGGDGMLGNNTVNVSYSSPVQIPGTTWGKNSFVGTDSGSKFMTLVKTDGTLWVWGSADDGGLGGPSPGHVSSPIQIPGTTWSQSSFGLSAGTAIKTDGTLWAWGRNDQGQLGDNSVVTKSSPIQIPGTTWKQVFMGPRTTAATKTDGTLWTWGHNEKGMLAAGLAVDAHRSSPVQVPGTTWGTIVFDLKNAALASKTDGTLWAWGTNDFGNLGQNSLAEFSSPKQIPGTNWSNNISMNDYLTIAAKTDGTLWTWGDNEAGQLGINAPENSHRSSPTQLPGTSWSTVLGSITSGSYAPKAIRTDGTMWAWGHNSYGELGLNQPDNTKYSSPVQIPGTTWARVRVVNYSANMALKLETP